MTSRQEVLRDMVRMNACGDRLTGTDGHNAFCDMLESEIIGMGLKVFSKEYCFRKWEAQDFSLSVEGEEIPVSSPFITADLLRATALRLGSNSRAIIRSAFCAPAAR